MIESISLYLFVILNTNSENVWAGSWTVVTILLILLIIDSLFVMEANIPVIMAQPYCILNMMCYVSNHQVQLN